MGGRDRGVPGAIVGTFYIGKIKNFAFFKLERFKKFLKINERLYFLENFKGNLAIF